MPSPTNKTRTTLAALVLSAGGLIGIALHEGYSDKAIIPVPGDVPTIGFGETENVKMGDRTTPQKALVRLMADVAKREGIIKRCVRVPLSQGEYDAYMSLAYNIGTGAFCNSTLVKKLNAQDYDGACSAILSWDKFKGKSLPGLTARRQEEYRKCKES